MIILIAIGLGFALLCVLSRGDGKCKRCGNEDTPTIDGGHLCGRGDWQGGEDPSTWPGGRIPKE